MKAWNWIALASIAAGNACGANAEPTGSTNPASSVREDDLTHHPCGGTTGLACPSGKFCDRAQANACPGPEIQGTCRPIPEACVHIYLPTCGCDGQTYGNDCQAAASGVAVAYDGPCAPFCGGFAGLPCPGAGTCVDNATDGCDPAQGNFDCASLCRCEVQGLCDEGAHWDSSPEVCGCVWE
jgi:Kazal-type serine protease inhibitor domain